jgi:DNA-binding SARP family transcriptional activator
MWIGLLGPTDIRTSIGDVRLSAPKLRSVLAILTIHAGNVVSPESLAEAVWDGNWPDKWVVTMRNNVKKVRKALAPPDDLRIEWRSPGYCLQLRPDESDLAMFESLRKAGQSAAIVGDWQEALARLRQAESLWRGTAFADIESRLIRTQFAQYLEAQRTTVLETRIEAEVRLSLRGSAAAIPELQRLISSHPERESTYALAMLAMYRAGRQAEALALYSQARQLLVLQHGLDPGRELTGMHDRILAGDASLLQAPLGNTTLGLTVPV